MPAKTLDAYISSFPVTTQTILKRIRDIALKAAPGSEGVVSYGVGAIKRGGTYVVYFGGYPTHVSLYPVYGNDPVLGKAIAEYTSGKATAKFMLDKPIPYDLIKKIVQEKVKESDARVAAKSVKKVAKKVVKKVVKKTVKKAVKKKVVKKVAAKKAVKKAAKRPVKSK
jgi:uncharacterized protein YdhG (YjbR/CyaY superfamily)